MANRTVTDAKSIHGTNPQNLIEKIVRTKIYASVYWKEHCFGLTAEALIDKAVDLKSVGGMVGEPAKPTHFICLILKMLQIQPDKDIIIEFIRNEDYKYLRLLGAFYMRLVGRPAEVYTYLEPLYNDFRRVRVQEASGNFTAAHVDAVVDDMLRKDHLFTITLPHIPLRLTMERTGQLEPRVSLLDEQFREEQVAELEAEAGEAAEQQAALQEVLAAAVAPVEGPSRERRERSRERDRSRERRRRSSRSRSRDRDRDRDRERDKERDRDRDRDRDRERSSRGERDRDRDRDRDRRDRSRERYGERDRSRERQRDRERDRGRDRDDRGGKKGSKAADAEDPEIAEANALRAKLGLKPLK